MSHHLTESIRDQIQRGLGGGEAIQSGSDQPRGRLSGSSQPDASNRRQSPPPRQSPARRHSPTPPARYKEAWAREGVAGPGPAPRASPTNSGAPAPGLRSRSPTLPPQDSGNMASAGLRSRSPTLPPGGAGRPSDALRNPAVYAAAYSTGQSAGAYGRSSPTPQARGVPAGHPAGPAPAGQMAAFGQVGRVSPTPQGGNAGIGGRTSPGAHLGGRTSPVPHAGGRASPTGRSAATPVVAPPPPGPTPTPSSAGSAASSAEGWKISDPSGERWQDLIHKYVSGRHMSLQPTQIGPPPAYCFPGAGKPERIVRLDYNIKDNTYSSSELVVKFDQQPFSKGAMRAAYRVQVLQHLTPLPDWISAHEKEWVGPEGLLAAKVNIPSTQSPQEDHCLPIFLDVEMQALASHYAEQFNRYKPPKRVKYLPAFILLRNLPPEDFKTPHSPGVISQYNPSSLPEVLAGEPFLGGKFKKYNDNWDWSDDHRNTPHAFSHFTYCKSQGRLIVVDVQGATFGNDTDTYDVYTDPQVHTKEGKHFGRGNMGLRGVEKFFDGHQCNPLCKHLGLFLHNYRDTPANTLPPARMESKR